MLYPPFAWYRVIFLLEDACLDYSCFQLDALFSVRAPRCQPSPTLTCSLTLARPPARVYSNSHACTPIFTP